MTNPFEDAARGRPDWDGDYCQTCGEEYDINDDCECTREEEDDA